MKTHKKEKLDYLTFPNIVIKGEFTKKIMTTFKDIKELKNKNLINKGEL